MSDLLQQAALYYMQGRIDESLAAFEQVILLEPKNAAAYTNYSVVLRAAGRLEEACRNSELSLRLNPDDAVAYGNYSIVLMDLGKLADALNACEHSIRLNPANAETYSNLGMILKQLGRVNDAVTACERAISIEPGHVGAYTNYAIALNEQGQKEKALAAFKQVARLNPDNAHAYINLAGVCKGLGRKKEAIEACEQAVRLSPHDARIYTSYGITLKEFGFDEEALSAYDRAVNIDPKCAAAHYNRGELLRKLERHNEAVAAYKTALRFSPGMVDAEYSLASMGAGVIPAQSPARSTKEFFDNYADHFDDKLVNELNYRTPKHIHNLVSNALPHDKRELDILDLGCGTGLCGALFNEQACKLIGVDLAPRMLSRADERGVYTELAQGDVCQYMENSTSVFDVILSADVFVYIGDLEECFSLVHAHLKPDGLFSFSIEINQDGKDYVITSMGRYAQSPDYIRRLSNENNFSEAASEEVVLRHDEGQPVPGLIFVLRKQ